MNLKNLAKIFLELNGYDGLYLDSCYDCACKIDDLMPCSEPSPNCTAGYLQPIDHDNNPEDHTFIIGPTKPEADDD